MISLWIGIAVGILSVVILTGIVGYLLPDPPGRPELDGEASDETEERAQLPVARLVRRDKKR